MWIERDASPTNPLVTASTLVAPPLGPLGIGNAADTAAKVVATPAALAASYNFPLPTNVATDPVALVETVYGSTAALTSGYNQYRQALGLAPGTLQYASGATLSGSASGELAADISVVAGAVPNSIQLRMYCRLWYLALCRLPAGVLRQHQPAGGADFILGPSPARPRPSRPSSGRSSSS